MTPDMMRTIDSADYRGLSYHVFYTDIAHLRGEETRVVYYHSSWLSLTNARSIARKLSEPQIYNSTYQPIEVN